jgi:hypothetical protein
MIKQILVISLLFIPAITASTSCPTCKKGHIVSSLEETLITRQKAKDPGLKKISLDSSFFKDKTGNNLPAKSPTGIIMNQDKKNNKETQTESIYKVSVPLALKRDEILEISNTPFKSSYMANSYASYNQGNQNIRETSNRNLQYQLVHHIR